MVGPSAGFVPIILGLLGLIVMGLVTIVVVALVSKKPPEPRGFDVDMKDRSEK